MAIPSTVDLDKRVHQAIAPLYANELLLKGGHNDAVLNATVTFVRRRNRVFAITCHHVLEAFRTKALESGSPLAPTVHFGHGYHQFISASEPMRWTFASCREFPDTATLRIADSRKVFEAKNASLPDIAIAEILPETWANFCRYRPREPIDLDDWVAPPWKQLGRLWAAYGFPTSHKYVIEDKVAAPMPRVVAELRSELPQDRENFSLFSSLDRQDGITFSGISGGPVIAESEDENCFYFTGLVFEGLSGTPNSSGAGEVIFGPGDIHMRCYLLTPDTFDRWYDIAKHFVELE